MKRNKIVILLLPILLLIFLFAPIPQIQTEMVVCEPCINQEGFICPPCPKKGDITWGPSVAAQIWLQYRYPSTMPTVAIEEETVAPSPRMEKMPWENSTCGNSICEMCESEDACCNYPPTRDKNGTMIYPPPTCMGSCAIDCKSEKGTKSVTGTITSYSNDLPKDGNCVIVVKGINIAIGIGGDRMPAMKPQEKGRISGINCTDAELSNAIGRNVSAYGYWNGYYLTVEGDTRYYVEVK